MPQHDPTPPKGAPDYARAAEAWARYKRMMKWMTLIALVCALLSIAYLKSAGEPVPFHMMIATMAGVFLSILVGTALMGLVFLSNRSGYDEEAGRKQDGEEE